MQSSKALMPWCGWLYHKNINFWTPTSPKINQSRWLMFGQFVMCQKKSCQHFDGLQSLMWPHSLTSHKEKGPGKNTYTYWFIVKLYHQWKMTDHVVRMKKNEECHQKSTVLSKLAVISAAYYCVQYPCRPVLHLTIYDKWSWSIFVLYSI